MKNEHKIFKKEGYILQKNKLSETEIKKIKDDLIVTPKVNANYSKGAESHKLFTETNSTITIPKYYGIDHFGKYTNRPKSGKINIKFKGKLRPYQTELTSKCLKDIKTKGGGVISLACGQGKTVIAINLATRLNVKTLVVVHKTFLQNQWIERIQEFTDAKIGIIRQKKKDVENKDIVVGMLQSIAMIDYDPSIFEDFGLVIYDECHHCPAKVFSQALRKTGTKYTIGLSATPYRKDGLTPVLFNYLGDIIYKKEKAGDNRVMVKIFNYESTSKLFAEKKSWFNGKIVKSIPKMITNITKIDDRNQFIVDILNTIKNNSDRKTLVISDRLAHLDILKTNLDNIITQLEKDGQLDVGEISTAKYIGGMRENCLKLSTEADIIFATYGMAEEGLDIDGLNTIVLATPKNDVVQTIGRIMRKPIKDGDVMPLIIDIVDQFSSFISWADKRKTYYEKKEYDLSFYEAKNKKCISIQEYLKIKNLPENNLDLLETYLENRFDDYCYEMLEEEEYDLDKIAKQIKYLPDLTNIFYENTDTYAETINKEKTEEEAAKTDEDGSEDDMLAIAKKLRQK